MANTARRPNIHWYMKDLRENGFLEALEKYKDTDAIVGIYVPPQHLQAWARLSHERVPPEVLAECKAAMKAHPVELTIRQDDAERTMYGTWNESHVCPPDCS